MTSHHTTSCIHHTHLLNGCLGLLLAFCVSRHRQLDVCLLQTYCGNGTQTFGEFTGVHAPTRLDSGPLKV